MSPEDLQQRQDQLPAFAKEGANLLLELAQASELDAPERVLTQADQAALLLQTVDAQLTDAYLEAEDRDWLIPRLGYAIGQYFLLDYEAQWSVNTQRDSPQYGHYVVLVPSPSDPSKVYPVDPFEAAYEYAYQEPDRDLLSLLDEVVGLLE